MNALSVPALFGSVPSHAAVAALGWTLVDFLWQGALIGCVAAIGLMLLRNARPQARYAWCCITLASCLLVPLAGLWRSVGVDDASGASALFHFPAAAATAPIAIVHTPMATPDASFAASLPLIVTLWSIGAALLAARMAMGMVWVARAGRAQALPHPRWQRRLDRLAETLGVACRVRLRIVTDLATPVAAGCWKPVVLVPASVIAELPLDLVEALLAHELAHVRRHDYLVNLVQCAIEALLFYHPVVWWLSRRIRIEREQIADDFAVAAIGEPRRLALALHELDLHQQRWQAGDGLVIDSLLPAANGGQLMSRIQRLVRPNPHALNWSIALPIIGLGALCVAVYAHDSRNMPAGSAAPAIAATAQLAEAAPGTAAPANARPVLAAPGTAAPANAKPVPAVPDTPAPTNARPAIAAPDADARAIAMPATTAAPSVPAFAASRAASLIARATDRHGDAYAIVRDGKDGIQMSGDSSDIATIEQLRKTVHGDFIWVRRGDRTYIVHDAATLAGVINALKPVDALDAQMQALDERMKSPNAHMEELNRRMEALDGDDSPFNAAMEKSSAKMDAMSRQQDVFAQKMEALANRMERASDAQRPGLESEMKVLQAQMEPINRQMEELGRQMEEQGKQFETSRKPMEDLAKQMEEASKPMEQLGKQMEVLGKQEEQISREVEQRVQATLDAALRDGKAVPAGGSVRRE